MHQTRFFPSPLVSLCLLIYLFCTEPSLQAQIQVSVPTIEQEATSIWRTINDIEFLEQQGYNIQLPDHEVIKAMLAKSKNQQFGSADFPRIYELLESSIYDPDKYTAALEKVRAQEPLLNAMIARLKQDRTSWPWEFKTFETYSVAFTLYGTGGSYDPDQGLVTLFTNEAGGFMGYPNPANTIIHEIVHMGIEQSIVQTHQLSHGLKERIVDRVTYLLFGEQLPDYRVQNMGDPQIDAYLAKVEDVQHLEAQVRKYLEER
ncbi:MAG: hypothetical protein AAF146_18800 [Bacteroidota bacterium]